jgi:hypothetical protein
MHQTANGFTSTANTPDPLSAMPRASPRRATKTLLMTRVNEMALAPRPVTHIATQTA